jgi:serine/threonine protein phosphatase PrpC
MFHNLKERHLPRNSRKMLQAAAPMLDVQFGQASDFGKVRTNNEDAMGSFIPHRASRRVPTVYLFAVADGVGGMDLGEVASATAISVITEEFAKAQAGTMLISLLPRLIQHANAAVHDCRLEPEYRGKKMATTLVACALRYDQASSRMWATRAATWSATARPGRLRRTTPGSTSSARWA